MSIENAAREIAKTYFDMTDEQGNCEEIPHLCEIIRRHLFPSVKPSELEHNAFYWTLFDGCWTIEVGYEIERSNPCDEIRGPIPYPE